MNIVQITASDTGIGGASRIACDIHSELKKRGHSPSLFTGTNFSKEPSIFPIQKRSWMKVASFLCATDINFWNTNTIIQSPQIKEADVIHIHNIHGYWFNIETLYKLSILKPVLWTLHDMWSITPHCAHSPASEPLDGFFPCTSLKDYPGILWNNERYLMRKKRNIYTSSSFSVATPSKWLEERVQKSVLKDKDITTIYNGIDTNVFIPKDSMTCRKKLNLPEDSPIALFIAAGGLRNEFKGGDTVLELAKRYKEIFFVVVGEKQKHIEQVFSNIKIIPPIQQKEILTDYYNACTLLLFPSKSENFPLVVLESLSVGRPVLAYDVGGVKEIIAHKQIGYIARTQDKEDFTLGFEYLLSLDEFSYKNMEVLCRQHIQKHFSLEIMINNYILKYRDLIK